MRIFLYIASLTILKFSLFSQSIDEAKKLSKTDPDSAISMFQSLAKDGLNESAYVNYLTARTYQKSDRSSESIPFFEKALKGYLLKSDNTMTSKVWLYLGNAYYDQRAYREAMKSYIEAWQADDKYEMYLSQNIGLVHQRFHNYDSAIYYHTKAYHISLKEENTKFLYDVMCELGHTYFYAKQYRKSIEWYEDLLHLAESNDNDRYYGYALNNIGNAYHDSGVYELSIKFLNKALPFKEPDKILTTYLNLGENYDSLGNYHQAVKNYKLAVNSEINERNKSDHLQALTQLGIAYSKIGTLDSAYMYMQLAATKANKDALEHNESVFKAKLFDMQLAQMAFEMELQQEEMNRQFWLAVYIGIGIICILGILFWYYKTPSGLKSRLNISKLTNREYKKTIAQYKEQKKLTS